LIRVSEIPGWVKEHPVRAGAMAGWFQQAAGAGIGILLVPALARLLSPAECGLWFAFQGTVAIAGLADLGLGFAISRQASYCLGQREGDRAEGDFLDFGAGGIGLSSLNAHGALLYRALALVAFLGGLLIYEWVASHTRMLEGVTGDPRQVFYLMLVVPVCMLLANRANSLLVGTGNMFAARLASGLFMSCQGFAVLVAALLTKDLLWMAAASATLAVIYLAAITVVARKIVPGLAAGHSTGINMRLLRRLGRISGPVGLVNIGGYLVNAIQVPAVGAMMGPTLVAPFYLAQRIGLFLSTAALQTHHSRLPVFTRLYAGGNYDEALVMMNRGLKIATASIFGAALVFVCFGPGIAWIFGKNLVLPRELLALMALDYVLMGSAVIWAQYIMAGGRNPFTLTTLLNGGLNIFFLSQFVPRWGLMGIPLSAIISGLLSNYGYIIYQVVRFRRSLPVARTQAAG